MTQLPTTIAADVSESESPDPDLHTFRHVFARACRCHGHRFAHRRHVLEQAINGGAICSRCGERSDLREALRHFHTLGHPEALLGLDVFVLSKEIPATSMHQVMIVDPEVSLPYECTLVYANYTPGCAEFAEAPRLLAPQSTHQKWGLHMQFYVPPGGKRSLSISLAVKPKAGLPEPLEIALQAVDAFHRGRLELTGILLGAAVEAIIRPLSETFYLSRSVAMPSDLGFAGLLERARLLFEPQLGAQLIGHLRELAKTARNPGAHGQATQLNRDEVAMWMVDVAVLYEWARVAKPIGTPV